MGVPAVVSDVKGNREAVRDGVTGFVVPYGNVEKLADAVERLILNVELRCDMGEEARRMALERFDERIVIDRMLRAYDRLVQEKLGMLCG